MLQPPPTPAKPFKKPLQLLQSILLLLLLSTPTTPQTHNMYRFDFPEVDDLINLTDLNFFQSLKKFHYLCIHIVHNLTPTDHTTLRQNLIALSRTTKKTPNAFPIATFDLKESAHKSSIEYKYGLKDNMTVNFFPLLKIILLDRPKVIC
jgi:hypothetical protein